jgi:hypothetical protein
VTRGIGWGSTDRTGGPIDEVFAALRRSFPDIRIERLLVTHAADDDNVWFITRPGGSGEFQVDSMPNGSPPFLLESESARGRVDEVGEVIATLTEWLENLSQV